MVPFFRYIHWVASGYFAGMEWWYLVLRVVNIYVDGAKNIQLPEPGHIFHNFLPGYVMKFLQNFSGAGVPDVEGVGGHIWDLP